MAMREIHSGAQVSTSGTINQYDRMWGGSAPSASGVYYNSGDGKYYVYKPVASSGGGGASGGSAGTGGGGGYAGYDPMAAAQSLYEQQKALAEQRRAQMDAARVAGYDAMAEARHKGYDRGATQANQVTDQALQEAYVNKMMSGRNLDQKLSALGRSGGAAESTVLNLENSYGRQRGEHERERANALSDLQLVLDQGLLQDKKALEDARANDMAAYYDSMSNIETQFAQAQMAAAEKQAALLAANTRAAGGARPGGGNEDVSTYLNLLKTLQQINGQESGDTGQILRLVNPNAINVGASGTIDQSYAGWNGAAPAAAGHYYDPRTGLYYKYNPR